MLWPAWIFARCLNRDDLSTDLTRICLLHCNAAYHPFNSGADKDLFIDRYGLSWITTSSRSSERRLRAVQKSHPWSPFRRASKTPASCVPAAAPSYVPRCKDAKYCGKGSNTELDQR